MGVYPSRRLSFVVVGTVVHPINGNDNNNIENLFNPDNLKISPGANYSIKIKQDKLNSLKEIIIFGGVPL